MADRGSRALPLPKRFWAVWSCLVTSNTADGITMIALAWTATQLTSDATLISLVSAAERLPWLLLVVPIGVVVDRFRRLNLMSAASAVRAVALVLLAALVLTGQASIPALALVALLLGTAEVLFDTAAESLVPSLVPADRLPRAHGHLRSGEIVADDFVGKPLGGLLLKVGAAVPFLATAVGGIVVTTTLLLVRRRATEPTPVRSRQSLLSDAAEGVRAVWRIPALRMLAVSAVVINTFFATLLASQMLFARQALRLDSVGIALLFAAAAVGAVVGGQLAAAVVARFGAAATLTAALAAMGAGYLAVALVVPNVWLVGSLYLVVAALVTLYGVASLSVRQRVIPHELLGRVAATLRLATWGMSTVGLLLGGLEVELLRRWLTNVQALSAPYAVTGAVYLLIAVILHRPIRRAFQHPMASDAATTPSPATLHS